MKSITAIVLVGGKGTRLKGLTKNKTKSYVSILGKYRVIDFALSTLSNSSIYDIGILMQYEPYELMRYIGSGASWDVNSNFGGISFLTPYEASKETVIFQKGTANAVLSQIGYIKKCSSDYILIVPGDQICRINYEDVLKSHIANNASLTIVSAEYTKEDISRFGVLVFDENLKVTEFEEKPKNPKSSYISSGIYLFNKDILLKYLEKAEELVDFGADFIPYMISQRDDVYTYKLDNGFIDIGTVQSYFDINMSYIDNPNTLFVRKDKMKIYSRPFDYPPHKLYAHASVKMCFVADGVEIKGECYHSIISFLSTVDENSQISYSIILPSVHIGKNVVLKNAIVDEGLSISDNSSFVFDTPTIIDEDYLLEVNNG